MHSGGFLGGHFTVGHDTAQTSTVLQHFHFAFFEDFFNIIFIDLIESQSFLGGVPRKDLTF